MPHPSRFRGCQASFGLTASSAVADVTFLIHRWVALRVRCLDTCHPEVQG